MNGPRLTLVAVLSRLFGLSRFVAELGVLSSAVLSMALFVLSVLRLWPTLRAVFTDFTDEAAVKRLLVSAIVQADLLLVATALLIISLGLHVLFVGRMDYIPGWLIVKGVDDLKQKLLGVVAAALAATFFSVAVDWKGQAGILEFGLAIAVVMFAIAANVLVISRKGPGRTADADEEPQA